MREKIGFDLQILVDEISVDPKGMGYSGKSSQEIMDLLNAVGGSGETVNVGVLDAYLIVNELVVSEFTALSATKRQAIQLVVSAGQVDVSNEMVKNLFLNCFEVGSETRDNLIAIATRSASRAEVLGLPTIKKEYVEWAQE